MKRIVFVFTVFAFLLAACAPAQTPRAQVALATATLEISKPTVTVVATRKSSATNVPTKTRMPTLTALPTRTRTPTPTATATNTSTPRPTATATAMGTAISLGPTLIPTPEITPMSMTLLHINDVAGFPDEIFKDPTEVFGKPPFSLQVGDYYVERSPDIKPSTLIERLPNYPGFQGAVVHVKINNDKREVSMQHANIGVNRLADRQFEGAWAYEVSILVLHAPTTLVDSGWMGDPISPLTSVLMHPTADFAQFRAAGGVTLVTDGNGKYYVQQYRVNHGDPGVTPNRERRVPFQIGVKQGIRTELFYDSQNNNKPSIRSFVITYTDKAPKYTYIGTMPLDTDIQTIKGDITWLGAYVSNQVLQYEVIAGEGKVFK